MTFKPLKQRLRDDLVDLAIEQEIYITDETKDEIIAKLAEVGITNASLRKMEEKAAEEAKAKEKVALVTEKADEGGPAAPSIPDGKAAVYMSRNNLSFLFRGARFSRTERIQLLDIEDADELIATYPGFQKLSRKEVLEYYK